MAKERRDYEVKYGGKEPESVDFMGKYCIINVYVFINKESMNAYEDWLE